MQYLVTKNAVVLRTLSKIASCLPDLARCARLGSILLTFPDASTLLGVPEKSRREHTKPVDRLSPPKGRGLQSGCFSRSAADLGSCSGLFQKLANLLEILPKDFLLAGIAQHVGRVDRGDSLGTSVVVEASPDFQHAFLETKHGARCRRPQATNQAGLDRIKLTEQEGRTGVDFVLLGGAVARRAAFNDVADVHIFALDSYQFQHAVQEFTGAADKRQPLLVFIRARSLADEDQLGMRMALAKHDMLAPLGQLAALAVAQIFADLVEGLAAMHRWNSLKQIEVLDVRF